MKDYQVMIIAGYIFLATSYVTTSLLSRVCAMLISVVLFAFAYMSGKSHVKFTILMAKAKDDIDTIKFEIMDKRHQEIANELVSIRKILTKKK